MLLFKNRHTYEHCSNNGSTTLSIMTLSIMIFSITIITIMDFIAALSIAYIKHNNTQHNHLDSLI